MLKKRLFTCTVSVILAAMLITGYMAFAAEYGSQDDPLVTLSYITQVLSPETKTLVEQLVNEKAQQAEKQLDDKITSYSNEIDAKLSSFENKYTDNIITDDFVKLVADAVADKISSGTSAAGWSVVKVASGKTLMLPLGSEVVLRLGSGTCYSTGNTGLINLSNGNVLSNGTALSANNLYLVTIDGGRGVKATSDMTVMVSGSYTIQD